MIKHIIGWSIPCLFLLTACHVGSDQNSAASAVPSIITQPTNEAVAVGQAATFTVTATGTAPLQYQWQKNATNITGATASSYTTPATTTADGGSSFRAIVTNAAGHVTSTSAALTVTAAAVAPTITTQPANQSVQVGRTATFTVVATGTAPLAYQWRKGSSNIQGATSATYTTAAAIATDNGAQYSAVVSNSAGSATSNSALLTVTASSSSGGDVVTFKNDALRTGQYLTEAVLTPANVNSATFGLLHTLAVDGKVDAEPLYLSQLTVGGAARNVVFVVTENDSAYAFDADTGTQLWHVSVLGSGETPGDGQGCGQISPTIGITATPVIDRAAGAHGVIYVVGMAKDGMGNYYQRLHALDVTTGAESAGSPITVSGTFGSTSFVPGDYAERAGMLLVNHTIYMAWTSHCDQGTYGGWVMAYNQSNLAQVSVTNVAAGASGVGFGSQGPAIWMSGGGLAADASGDVYFLTANGKFDTNLVGGFPALGDYGNSFMRLRLSNGTLSVADYFTLYNSVGLSIADGDLGSGGIMLLPDLTDGNGAVHHLAVGAGKDKNIFVVDRDNMGKFNPIGNMIYQEFDGATGGSIFSSPAYFNGMIYYGGVSATLRGFAVSNAAIAGTPAVQTTMKFGFPGTSPVISASGTSNGIVWAHENASTVGVLHAFDAATLTELYNTNQVPARDRFGVGNKFIVPMVAGGKVFVGTTNSVAVYGLLN